MPTAQCMPGQHRTEHRNMPTAQYQCNTGTCLPQSTGATQNMPTVQYRCNTHAYMPMQHRTCLPYRCNTGICLPYRCNTENTPTLPVQHRTAPREGNAQLTKFVAKTRRSGLMAPEMHSALPARTNTVKSLVGATEPSLWPKKSLHSSAHKKKAQNSKYHDSGLCTVFYIGFGKMSVWRVRRGGLV